MYTFTISRKEFQQAVMDGENPVLMGLKEQHGVDGFMLPFIPVQGYGKRHPILVGGGIFAMSEDAERLVDAWVNYQIRLEPYGQPNRNAAWLIWPLSWPDARIEIFLPNGHAPFGEEARKRLYAEAKSPRLATMPITTPQARQRLRLAAYGN